MGHYEIEEGYMSGPEIPIIENAIATHPVDCPGCGTEIEYEECYVDPHHTNDLAGREYEFAGWGCGDCCWEQEVQEEDFERLHEHNKGESK